MNGKVVFDKSVRKQILEIFGKTTDAEGYVVEKSDKSQKVLNNEGEEFTIDEFAGIKSGSLVFIKDNLVSLMNIAENED